MSDAPGQPRGEGAPLRSGPLNHLYAFCARHPAGAGLSVVLVLGLAARLALSLHDGHLSDTRLFHSWMRALVEDGLGRFYSVTSSCNYPPLFLLILRGLGEVLGALGIDLKQADLVRACLRIPACLADVVIALLLWREARRRWSARAGVLAAALYFLNPVSLYNSAYWGQVDSIHSACVLGAVVALNRRRPLRAGLTVALGLLQKFQAVVFLPLVLFDVYRYRRWRGLAWTGGGVALAAIVVLGPFVRVGALADVIDHGYITAVGKFNRLSVNAFNLWYLTGTTSAPSDSVPPFIVEAAAAGAQQVSDDAWLMWFTWRRIGLGLFVLMVALTLTVYSRCHSVSARALAAGVLGLVFFLFPTEMHERYAYPALAVLPLWAVGGPWKERVYVLLSVLMLLNLTVAQPVDEIGPDIAVLNLVLCSVFLAGLALPGLGLATATFPPQPRRELPRADDDTPPPGGAAPGLDPGESPHANDETPLPHTGDETPPPPPSAVVRWFCRLTLTALAAALVMAAAIVCLHARAAPPPATGTLYLSDLEPARHHQGYGQLQKDRSVEGGAIHLGSGYYLRGLGTHAPSTMQYDLPDGYTTFRAVVGIDRHATGAAGVRVYLDGRSAFESERLTPTGEPVELDIPLGQAKRLKLEAVILGSKKGDHVDWALARLEP